MRNLGRLGTQAHENRNLSRAEHMRIGTWVRGDLGGKRDSSVKVGRALFAAFQRSPIIDEIRQPVYPASTLEQQRDALAAAKLNLQFHETFCTHPMQRTLMSI